MPSVSDRAHQPAPKQEPAIYMSMRAAAEACYIFLADDSEKVPLGERGGQTCTD